MTAGEKEMGTMILIFGGNPFWGEPKWSEALCCDGANAVYSFAVGCKTIDLNHAPQPLQSLWKQAVEETG